MGKRRFDANATIATLLIRAQNASDGGKGKVCFTGSEKAASDNAAGYIVKDACIREAIKLIQEHNTVFQYYLMKNYGDRKTRYFVTFVTSIDGKQDLWVTFHLKNGVPNCKHRPRYHGEPVASGEAAACIYRYFCPLGEYCEFN